METVETKTGVDVKTIEAELDEIKTLLKQFDSEAQETFLGVFRNIDNYLDIVLPDRESQLETTVQENEDETEFFEYALVVDFLENASDHEKVFSALMSGLSVADDSHSEAGRYLAGLWQEKRKACIKDVKALMGDSELGSMATMATILNGIAGC